MDITGTAQTVTAAATAAHGFGWLHLVGAWVVGLFTKFAAQKLASGITPTQVQNVAADVKALAPAAEAVATLAGQPALAGGIELASKAVDAMSKTTDPNQLAALAVAHAQALAAAADPAVKP